MLKYAAEGFKALFSHSSRKSHVKNIRSVRGSNSLKRYVEANTPDDIIDHDRPVDFTARKVRQEVLISSFIAENNLAFSMGPKIIDLARELSRDHNALKQTSLSRTTLAYKFKYGLAKTIKEEIVSNLKLNSFQK